MEAAYRDVVELARRPAVVETAVDILLCAVPIWAAVMIGLVIGWSWRPRWTGLLFLGLRSRLGCLSKLRFLSTAAIPPGLGARRLWFAFTALSAFSVCRSLWSGFFGRKNDRASAGVEKGAAAIDLAERSPPPVADREDRGVGSRSGISKGEENLIVERDLEHLVYLLDNKVGDATWQNLMERTTPNMSYQAWQHEPEVGPIMYKSRTVFEDATPELVRDFFWDDDFRCKWDAMLAYFKVLEEFSDCGTMIVHWIKKFPFFCSDREYIIGRRIWECGKTYYCITKGVPYLSIPRNERPRRVEHYFSSWRIRAVESRKKDGQLSACEVALIHYEDMGIPKDVAKVGVRHGMWGAVKKLQAGMRSYQIVRKSEAPLSRCSIMARMTTKMSSDSLRHLNADPSDAEEEDQDNEVLKANDGFDWRWVVIGGTVAVVCGLPTGLLGRTLLFGAARRLAGK